MPNGRPYWIPTKRKAAAPPSRAASAVPGPPHCVPAQRSKRRLRVGLD